MTNVYVISSKSGQCKVGVSEWPAMRLRQLQSKHDTELTLAHVFKCGRHSTAYHLERQIHEQLAEYALGNEWFRCIPEVAVSAGLDAGHGNDAYPDF